MQIELTQINLYTHQISSNNQNKSIVRRISY